MSRFMAVVFLLCVALYANTSGQVRLQPQPPPETTAVNAQWYLTAEPLPIFGDYYFPTGPTVYFNANQMVPTATYDGVTLYADTTLEPYSVVFVPIGRGLMRPYERRRSGVLAGTVGSRMPSFPIQHDSEAGEAINPLISASAALPALPSATSWPTHYIREPAPIAVGTAGATLAEPHAPIPSGPPHMSTLVPPSSNDGVWIEFGGARWRAAGKAQDFSETRFVRDGDYVTFPVFLERNANQSSTPDRIYLPVANGRVAPYERIKAIQER